MDSAVAGIAALLGLIFGSFINVVAYRIPAGMSVVSPPSACPECNTPIRPRDNIPVLSW
ncbi:MAG: prepilin peptidase, partial [Acidimicrobiia bacterium]|nr:prepilin peptidase [Acidimicrobiia bacterium]